MTELSRQQTLLAKRHAAERRFRIYGLIAVALTLFFLIFILADIVYKAKTAFTDHYVRVNLQLDSKADPKNNGHDFLTMAKESLRAYFPLVTQRSDKKRLGAFISDDAERIITNFLKANPDLSDKMIEVDLLLTSPISTYLNGLSTNALSENEIEWINQLKADKKIIKKFAWRLFAFSDSREPELAGLSGAIIGSLLTVLVTLGISLPLGVAAAIYLEEFAPANLLTRLIEVNINNLAAVPSIIFGLLGLAVFLNLFGLPRSTPLVGGLVLALLVLPTIIISSRAALATVSPSIKEAALGVGASYQQAIFHHVLPLALPGILTGTILGVARAMGETAPLLMIGMVAFIVNVPHSLLDPAITLPIQIYLWSDLPEAGFQTRTAAAILILLLILFCLNATAIYLRKHFEQRS